MLIEDRLRAVAKARRLRDSTVYGYRAALKRLNVTDDSITQDEVEARLWEIDAPNSRRQATIAVRAVLDMDIPIPTIIQKRYTLKTEDDYRMILMLTPYETRGLIMMYTGLRVAEACAVTAKSIRDDVLIVDRQVIELRAKGQKISKLGPVKSRQDDVVMPRWLIPRVAALETHISPHTVRASIQRAGNRVGMHVTCHELRHWYATESLRRGVSMKTVSRQLRHGDIATTMRTYAQGNAQEVHDVWG